MAGGKMRDAIPSAEAERMRARRLQRSLQAFQRSKDSMDRSGRLRGAYHLGRDERGNPVETEEVSSLKLAVRKWLISISFRREDGSRLPSNYLDAEDAFKAGPLPRNPLWTHSHIISAVRMLRHIREGYERELNLLDRILSPIEDAESSLRFGPSEEARRAGLEQALFHLTLCRQRFEDSQVLVKRLIVPSAIDDAVSRLQNAKSLEAPASDEAISQACRSLSKLRSRIEWRMRQVSGMRWKGQGKARTGGLKQFSARRESALRPLRDQWLLAQMMRFSESPEALIKHGKEDHRKLAVLDAARSVLKGRAKGRLQVALNYLEANWRIFEVPQRQKEGAERSVGLMLEGISTDEGRRLDYLYGNYRKLFRHVLNQKRRLEEAAQLKAQGDAPGAKAKRASASDEHAKAMLQLDLLSLFVQANKPAFILDEIIETIDGHKDAYLSPLVQGLGRAMEALNREEPDVEEARRQFLICADALRPFVAPGS